MTRSPSMSMLASLQLRSHFDVVVNGGGGTDTLRLTSESPCQLSTTRFRGWHCVVRRHRSGELITTCAGVTATQSFASGYWLVDATGRISTFGLDHFGDHTTLGGVGAPVSGLGDRPDKLGYWTVQANGDVTAFGSAEDFGDLPGIAIVPAFPIVGWPRPHRVPATTCSVSMGVCSPSVTQPSSDRPATSARPTCRGDGDEPCWRWLLVRCQRWRHVHIWS